MVLGLLGVNMEGWADSHLNSLIIPGGSLHSNELVTSYTVLQYTGPQLNIFGRRYSLTLFVGASADQTIEKLYSIIVIINC